MEWVEWGEMFVEMGGVLVGGGVGWVGLVWVVWGEVG